MTWERLVFMVAGLVAIAVARAVWEDLSARRATRLAARLGGGGEPFPSDSPEPESEPEPEAEPDRRWLLYALVGGLIGLVVALLLERRNRIILIERRRRPRRFGITHPDYR